MTLPVDLARLTPQQRAAALLSSARADMADRLWSAAIGTSRSNDGRPATDSLSGGPLSGGDAAASGGGLVPRSALDALLDRLLADETAAPAAPAPAADTPATESTAAAPAAGLGANSRYGAALNDAAERAGIPAPALAAIIDAEAARNRDGSWNPHSRNSRSSAAGLGQFLSGTWLGMARTPGTWLNALARQRGLVDAAGHISGGARAELLALRYDPAASIQTIADYARGNVQRLRRAGVDVGAGAQDVARAAYIGHHLGPGDALRFYSGTLAPERARVLLTAQIGPARAARQIAASGDPAQAHRTWLLGHIARHVDTARYAAPADSAIALAATGVNDKIIG